MAILRHLPKAPIVEAVIDIRVKNPPSLKIADLLFLEKSISQEYPHRKERRRMVFGGKVEGQKIEQTVQDKGVDGYLFTSEGGKDIVQFRLDGFTFSRLKPYPNWQIILAEAKRLWDLYRSKIKPELITRTAVRNINRIDLRPPIFDFSEYLSSPPQIPKSLPQEVNQFLSRIVLHETDLTATIVQTLVPSPEPECISIILDIDVFKEDLMGIDERIMWEIFKKIREFKNRIFFELITEKTARLFE
ncbi:MAG: TIGR04255 family protein [Chloroflexi bacterium]|nr:TIGR04255 family protein [Chloroflexota bacterium]